MLVDVDFSQKSGQLLVNEETYYFGKVSSCCHVLACSWNV